MDLKQFKDAWNQWQVEHPMWARTIVIAEGAALGAIVDLLTNGMDFTQGGLKHAATIVGAAVFIAVRNYLKDNLKNLKLQQEQKVEKP